jgi:F-type H+-transporting ATPase subunit epsilon
MLAYNLLIATSESTLFHADVKTAVFLGADGYFEILANHAPLIALVKKGHVKVTNADGQEQRIEIGEGFLEFHENQGVLLADPN